MLLDYIIKIDNDYCPQIFLDECKYAINKRKIMNEIHEELNLINLMMMSLMNLINLMN